MRDFLPQPQKQGDTPTREGGSALRDGIRKIINAALGTDVVRSAINAQIEKYATIHDLALVDDGIRIRAQLLGSRDIFTATATRLEIDADNKTFCVRRFASDMPWADHVLNDFVANETFSLDSLPTLVITALANINSFLK